MQYINYIEINGVRGDIPVNQSGKGAPTTSTEGAVAQIYMDENTGDLYKCIQATKTVFTWVKIEAGSGGTVTVDSALSSTSENPVQNKVIKAALDEKQAKGDYLTDETDPTVPAWAKAETKPTYTASEVGALPVDTVIPDAYTLPVATSSELGGVKADSAQSTDTQAVRIGTDGKLYTAPGSGGSSGDSPVKLIANNDSTNKKPLRSIDSGTYVLSGYFTSYEGGTESFTFNSGMVVAILKESSKSYVQVFYPKSNVIQYLEITDSEVTRKDAKLVDMESVSNRVSSITSSSDTSHYPSAKAVYDAIQSSGIPQTGETAPEGSTKGVVGQSYFVIVDNTVTEMYVCTSAAVGSYVWDKVEFGAEIDDTSTEPTKVWSAEKCNQLSEAITDKLNKSGDTLGGKFVIPTADTTAGFVNSEDMKIFGYGTTYFRMGDPNKPLQLRGNGTNPMYGDKKILVEGDVAGDSLLTVETIAVGDDSGETETVSVTGLSLDLTTYSATVGNGFYINPVITPSNATNKAVSWQSNAINIATVNDSGYVECIDEGDAIITCTTVDGGFTATCTVSIAADESGGGTEVTITGISATYSGGDVAVGTSVNDLTGIVVTATYSDGSTATVTDYTLSGTIAEGSNTITVSYGGKSTTFTVTGVAESTGGNVQLSTLEITDGLFKADGTITSLGGTYHVQIPYTEGMFISTGSNKAWNQTNYPAMVVLDNGEYTIPKYTVSDAGVIGVGGKYPTQMTCTLRGYSETAIVYVSFLAGGTKGSTLETNMDNAGIFYYIPGGEA